MAKVTSDEQEKTPVTRERLAELLNEESCRANIKPSLDTWSIRRC